MTQNIYAIAAASLDWAIGAQGDIPWYIPADLKYFKKKTLNQTVIMGRLTFESVGKRPLPRRHNIILTSDRTYKAPGCVVAHTIEEALTLAREEADRDVYVCGGGAVYEAFLPRLDGLYLTIVHQHVEGADAWFPWLNQDAWDVVEHQHTPRQEETPAHTFLFLTRREGVDTFTNQDQAHIPPTWQALGQ